MTTATETWIPLEWTKNPNCFWELSPGDKVRITKMIKKRELKGAEGIFVRHMQKNVKVLINGNEWSLGPRLLEAYQKGNPADIFEAQEESSVKTSASKFHAECSEGDIILCHRGGERWDIVKINEMPTGRMKNFRGTMVGSGKRYRLDPETYVQRLSSERIG